MCLKRNVRVQIRGSGGVLSLLINELSFPFSFHLPLLLEGEKIKQGKIWKDELMWHLE